MNPSRSGDRGALGARLPSGARVRRGDEIRELMRRGTRRRTSHLDVFAAPAAHPLPRFGAVVPRHRHTVVERNLLRRRLREIGRIEVLPRLRAASVGQDLLVRARPEAYDANFSDLRDELARLTERLCCDASPSP